MLLVTPVLTSVWLDGNTARPDRARSSQPEWPRAHFGTHADISHMTTNGTVMVCKSFPGTAYVGPDKHTRKYRIQHRRCWPLLPKLHLHSGPDKNAPIWATYRAKSFREAWVELPCRSTESTSHGHVKINRKKGGSRNKYVFTMKIRGHDEIFAWRRSRHHRTKGLGLSGNGYKLVRMTKLGHGGFSGSHLPMTNDKMQIVAIAGRSHHQIPRCLAFRYLHSFGDEWEVVSLVTLMAFWIWDRKHMSKG